MPPTAIGPEYATLDDFPLDTPAWRTQNLDVLWGGAKRRGSDTLIPGAEGVLPNPRRITSTQRTLAIAVFGDVDSEGTVIGAGRAGLEENWAELEAALDPRTDGAPFTCVL